ncbi:hypothetical protein CEXT_726611 [Caerostris extrusa]|uniref:TCTP domain-containing protein n=1 Tax=Caerostris extrusa TaxID=172846 RepID=A0AAV4VSX7_CAEEX|nr:hypothetical protein CEXT_726611 [Caerostris extrusa]
MGKSDSEISDYKSKFTKAVKKVLPKRRLSILYGESTNPDGLIALLEYREKSDGTETPIMILFKHGIEEEKV